MDLNEFVENKIKKETYTAQEVEELVRESWIESLNKIHDELRIKVLRLQSSCDQSDAAFEQKYGFVPNIKDLLKGKKNG